MPCYESVFLWAVHGDMYVKAEVKKKDKGTFFQVCFSLFLLPEAKSFYELAGLFLKSSGLRALQKQHRVPKNLKGRGFFLLFFFQELWELQ